MKNLRKINIIIAALLCAAVSVMAVIVSNIKIGGKDNEVMPLNAATALFDGSNNYNVNASAINVGSKFNMYGYDWTVVAKSGTIATLWMDAPMESVEFENFRAIPSGLGKNNEPSVYNIFNPAYLQGTWRGDNLGGTYGTNGTSKLRLRLLELENSWNLSGNANIKAGMQANNVSGGTISWVGSAGENGNTNYILFNDANGYTADTATGSIKLDWNIGATDKLWVPSKSELDRWGVDRSYLGGVNDAVWTRQANPYSNQPGGHSYVRSEVNNLYAWTVTRTGAYSDQRIYYEAGLRPAMNVDISAAQKYKVTWQNWDGSKFDTLEEDDNVPYGSTPSFDGATPTRQASAGQMYTFLGWSVTGQNGSVVDIASYRVEGNTTFTAIYTGPTAVSGKVTWRNGSTVVETDEGVAYGATPTFDGATPTKDADAQYTYTFDKWSPDIRAFTGDIEYTAQFKTELRVYTITWLNDDDSQIDTTQVAYNVTPRHTPAAKDGGAQYTYTFNGWTPVIVPVTGDATYKATYTRTIRTYTVTWRNNGTTLITQSVEYNTTPAYTGVEPSLTHAGTVLGFIGWRIVGGDGTVYDAGANDTSTTGTTNGTTSFPISGISAFENVTANVIYEAVYTMEKFYTLLWLNEDGTLIAREPIFYERADYDPNEAFTFRGSVPRKTFYCFNGWSTGVNGAVTIPTPTAVPNAWGDDENSNYTASLYSTTVSGDTTLYACFVATTPSVTTPPSSAIALQYNGSNQVIVAHGLAHNAVMEYSFGTEQTCDNNWQSQLLTKRDAGTYYVYYRARGATATTPQKLTITMNAKVIQAEDVTVADIPDQRYDKKGVNPQPIVTDADGVMVTGEWVWTNNKAVGTATGEFHANGNFTVEGAEGVIIRAEFNIVDKTPTLQDQLLKIAFVVLCVIGIISIICVAIVCSRRRIEKSTGNDINA